MSKKKKKVKVVYKDAPKKAATQSFSEQIRNQKLDPEQQKEATSRLVTLFKKLGEKPEPILDMFYRLEIPWARAELTIDGVVDNYIIIKAVELEAGEARHQHAGSIVNRLYGDKVNLPPEPEYDPKFVEPQEYKEALANWQEVPAPEPAPAFATMEEEPLAEWEKELMKNEQTKAEQVEDSDEYLRGIQG